MGIVMEIGMSREELKARVAAEIERHKEEIIASVSVSGGSRNSASRSSARHRW
jgi:hypothetical protein